VWVLDIDGVDGGMLQDRGVVDLGLL